MSAVASAFVSKHSVMFTLTAARNADSKLAKGPPRGAVERYTVSPGSTTNSLTPVVTKPCVHQSLHRRSRESASQDLEIHEARCFAAINHSSQQRSGLGNGGTL